MARKIFVETERLLLGEIMLSDEEAMFELDSNKEVHRFLADDAYENIELSRSTILNIRNQYREHGIGRWAMIERSTLKYIGWAGLKFETQQVNKHNNFYDLGYRLIPKYWGNGYATEAAIASVAYGFNTLQLEDIFASADENNFGSINVINKSGLKYVESFDDQGYIVHWFNINKTK